MISTIIIVIALLVAVGYGIAIREQISEGPKGLVMPIAIFVVGFLLAMLQPYALTRVKMSNIGLKVNLSGNERGLSSYQYKTGWVAYNEWVEQMNQYPTNQQHLEYDTIEVITKGGFAAKIKPSFNYSLVSTMIGDMFQNLNKPIEEIENGWLKNAIYSSINDVANQWPVDSIFNHREQFESGIIAECNKRVNKWFIVSQLRSNIVPPPSLQNAIIEKTKQIQLAQSEIQKAIVADAQAKVKIANARGDSAKLVIGANADANAVIIAATAEANAMKMKQVQLSQQYIDYIRATNWDGKYPTTILGGNSSTLLNLK